MGKWVTIKGSHVYIEDDGTITKGSKKFVKSSNQKSINELTGNSEHLQKNPGLR